MAIIREEEVVSIPATKMSSREQTTVNRPSLPPKQESLLCYRQRGFMVLQLNKVQGSNPALSWA